MSFMSMDLSSRWPEEAHLRPTAAWRKRPSRSGAEHGALDYPANGWPRLPRSESSPLSRAAVKLNRRERCVLPSCLGITYKIPLLIATASTPGYADKRVRM